MTRYPDRPPQATTQAIQIKLEIQQAYDNTKRVRLSKDVRNHNLTRGKNVVAIRDYVRMSISELMRVQRVRGA